MNARSVSKRSSNRAGLRFGKLFIAIALIFMPRLARAGEVVITVTGTLWGGEDGFRIFGLGKTLPEGTPFTVVATFDDTKGKTYDGGNCAGAGSAIMTTEKGSPGTAVLTINGKSVEFGHPKQTKSGTWRWIGNSCSTSQIGFGISEGPNESGVGIRVEPKEGIANLITDPDWRHPATITNMYGTPSSNCFAIVRPGELERTTQSQLNVKSIVISRK